MTPFSQELEGSPSISTETQKGQRSKQIKKSKKGIIYLSSIPPYMNVTKIKEHFSEFGKVGRVYLQLANKGNMDQATIALSLIEYLRFVEGNSNSRTVVEGEEVLNAGHIILCGNTKKTHTQINIAALCLQTSALNSEPHEISGELRVDDQNAVNIIKMFCTCKAGAGGCCKHISAVLILLTRKNLADLEDISSTDLACQWKRRKTEVQGKYKPVPVREMACLSNKLLRSNEVTQDEKEAMRNYLCQRNPLSAISKHITGHSTDYCLASTSSASSVSEPLHPAPDQVILMNNAAQSIVMMELASFPATFKHPCCKDTYDKILNQEVDDLIGTSQNSSAWHSARKYRITGSRCYQLYTYQGKDWEAKAKSYFWPKSFTNKFVRHGLKYEDEARAKLINETGLHVVQCGLVISANNKWLGFSPDGIIFYDDKPDRLLEIKCLYEGASKNIKDAICSCKYIINNNGQLELKKKHQYYGQIQLGMALLNLDQAMLVVFASYDASFEVIKVDFDYEFTKKMLFKLQDNFFKQMLHEVCKSDQPL